MINFGKAENEIAIYVSGIPTLQFTPEVMAEMSIYIEECDVEIGWLGNIVKVDDKTYLCDELYLPDQDVGAATTEIQPEDLVKLAMQLDDDTKLETMKLWGHSHAEMSVSPSGQDDKQIGVFRDSGLDVFFRIIANKRGDLDITFYDFKRNIEIQHLDFSVKQTLNINEEAIKKAVAEKVRLFRPIITRGRGKGRNIVSSVGYDGVYDYMYGNYDGCDWDGKLIQSKRYRQGDEELADEWDDDSIRCTTPEEAAELYMQLLIEGEAQGNYNVPYGLYDFSKTGDVQELEAELIEPLLDTVLYLSNDIAVADLERELYNLCVEQKTFVYAWMSEHFNTLLTFSADELPCGCTDEEKGAFMLVDELTKWPNPVGDGFATRIHKAVIDEDNSSLDMKWKGIYEAIEALCDTKLSADNRDLVAIAKKLPKDIGYEKCVKQYDDIVTVYQECSNSLYEKIKEVKGSYGLQ